jgi:hypothetical protein
MSDSDFNKGLDDAVFGEEMRSEHPDYVEGYLIGSRRPSTETRSFPVQEPTDADYCRMEGHLPYVLHPDGYGVCYCGEVKKAVDNK